MRILISTEAGDLIPLDLGADESVENVKALLEVETGIPLLSQRLTFEGTALDNTRMLAARRPRGRLCFLVWLVQARWNGRSQPLQ